MDFIIARGYYGAMNDEIYREDVGTIEYIYDLDMQLGEDDDFSLTIDLEESKNINIGDYIYSEFTEFGGRILSKEIVSKDNKNILKGETCRGLLKRTVISPPNGQEHLTVSGYFDDIVTMLLARTGSELGYLFSVNYAPGYESYYISSYQIRYMSLYDAIIGMLNTINCKLYVDNGRNGERGLTFYINAQPIVDYTNDFDFSQNTSTFFRIEDNQAGINTLICLGGGVGVDRLVKILYFDGVNIVDVNPNIQKGLRRYGKYDNVNADTIEELDEQAREYFLDLLSYKKTEITEFETLYNLVVGDIVGAYDDISKTTVSSPLISKNLVISGSSQKINYKLEGE